MIYTDKEVRNMRKKEKVDKERYTTYIPRVMAEQIRDISDLTGIPQSSLWEEAGRDLLTKYNGKIKYLEK